MFCVLTQRPTPGTPTPSLPARRPSSVAAMDAARGSNPSDEAARAASGPHAKRLRIADGNAVDVTPARDGIWQMLDDGSLVWRGEIGQAERWTCSKQCAQSPRTRCRKKKTTAMRRPRYC